MRKAKGEEEERKGSVEKLDDEREMVKWRIIRRRRNRRLEKETKNLRF